MIKKITVVFLLLLLCVSIVLLIDDYKYISVIPTGIYLGDMHIGGLTREEAKDKLHKFTGEILRSQIILTYNDHNWSIDVSEHLEVDVNKILENIITYTQNGNIIKRFILRQQLKSSPLLVNPVISFKEDNLHKTFKKINETIFVEPTDAFFKVKGETLSIVNDVEGQILDENKLKEDIISNLWFCDGVLKLEIPIKKCEADITKEDLRALQIKLKVAEYSTKFNKSQKGRTQNIKLAAEKINGYILSPGDIFSFNQVVGERTRDKGYQEAPVFIDNQTVPDIGGGVCQVSSTLYNLALLTNLEIIERMNHSLPVSYVPLGRDATVNYDTIDLKFKNSTDGNLLLISEVIEDTLTVKFFGKEKLPFAIDLISETVKTIPPPVTIKEDLNLAKGEVRIKQGTPGFIVRLWKKYTNEEIEDKILISTDTYSPTPTLLYTGVKTVESHESQLNHNED
ncbi:MAG: hypothetical protein GX892_16320 [Thermoanaerobacteraceae bacterium]|nr:hypothetical protein [Thermoanaerobacteraceae bacterium]